MKVVKNKAYFKRFQVKFRRRRGEFKSLIVQVVVGLNMSVKSGSVFGRLGTYFGFVTVPVLLTSVLTF